VYSWPRHKLGRGISFAPRPFWPWGKIPWHPLGRSLSIPQNRSLFGLETLCRTARSQSLYRLRFKTVCSYSGNRNNSIQRQDLTSLLPTLTITSYPHNIYLRTGILKQKLFLEGMALSFCPWVWNTWLVAEEVSYYLILNYIILFVFVIFSFFLQLIVDSYIRIEHWNVLWERRQYDVLTRAVLHPVTDTSIRAPFPALYCELLRICWAASANPTRTSVGQQTLNNMLWSSQLDSSQNPVGQAVCYCVQAWRCLSLLIGGFQPH
jgi:hypothetical protein